MAIPDLVLRDIHAPDAPAWWPPAPGWWWLGAVVLVLAAGFAIHAWRRARRRRRWARLFDETVDAAAEPPARIAAISGLLRRAARRVRPDADRLQGEAWLQFLDAGTGASAFVEGPGAALHDGAFRREAADIDIGALRALARARFLSLMAAGR